MSALSLLLASLLFAPAAFAQGTYSWVDHLEITGPSLDRGESESSTGFGQANERSYSAYDLSRLQGELISVAAEDTVSLELNTEVSEIILQYPSCASQSTRNPQPLFAPRVQRKIQALAVKNQHSVFQFKVSKVMPCPNKKFSLSLRADADLTDQIPFYRN